MDAAAALLTSKKWHVSENRMMLPFAPRVLNAE
jgi:hypothetical protein